MEAAKLDSVLAIETPEGVDICLTPAPVGLRCLAWVIDFCIKVLLVWLLAIGASLLAVISEKMALAGILLLMFFMEWFYGAFWESRFAATPGKMAVGLKVVSIRGTPITLEQAIVRSFLWLVDFLPFFYTTGLVSILFTRGQRRLADLAAGTVVIMAPEKVAKRSQVNSQGRRGRKQPAVTPVPPPLPLSPEEKALLVSYYRRSSRYHELYRRELAELLAPLHGLKGKEADERLLAYGAWLSGDAQEAPPTRVGRSQGAN
ncbi:MAG: hypothetical protein RL095_784 [Verrucomicrobiota bacterium]|jgi:uncharacterized RDD family membrane protein YckC